MNGVTPATDTKVEPHSRRELVVCALLVCLGIVVFFGLWWDRFAGLRSGSGGYLGAWYFLHDVLPFRDYFLFHPPFSIMRGAAIMQILGDHYMAFRVFGVMERLALGLVSFAFFARMFSVPHSAFATIFMIVVSTCAYHEPIDNYTYESILFAVLSGYLSTFVFDRYRTVRSVVLIALCAGVAAGLSLMTKQSIGVLITLAIAATGPMLFLRNRERHHAFGFLAGFIAGWCIPVGAVVTWCLQVGVLSEFWRQVFFLGPSAKGANASAFIEREVNAIAEYWILAVLALGPAGVFCKEMIDVHLRNKQPAKGSSTLAYIALGALFLAIAGGGVFHYLGNAAGDSVMTSLRNVSSMFCLFAVSFASLGAGVIVFVKWLKQPLPEKEAFNCLLCATTVTCVVASALTNPFTIMILVPGLGFLVAALLDSGQRMRIFVYVACTLITIAQVAHKLNNTYGFDNFVEPPVRQAIIPSSLPELSGLKLPPQMVDFIDGTVHIVLDNTLPSDTVFTYPEINLINVLSKRRMPTFSATQNMDVMPDALAKEDAERLLRLRPAVLVYMPITERELKAQELMWRGGKPSGNRLIIAACETLAKEYKLVKTYHLEASLGWKAEAFVYLRPDRVK